ncbi:hypothetical protein [Ferruginibacter sp.]
MKNLIVIFFFLISTTTNAQELNTAFDGHKWEAPYNLPIPKDWTIERFLIPISFAKQIPYKGVEDIRFTPGWAKAKSDEYWTYAFLWWLDDNLETDEKIIAANLKAYYTGLFKINTDSTKIPAGKIIPVTALFKEATTTKGDVKTYTGTIEMNDYMQLKPITLNCIAHLKFCEEDNKTILFYELSPQPFTHNIWLSLNQLWLDFKCKK